MTKEQYDKAQELQYLIRDADFLTCNGEIHSDSINYLYRHDDEFKKDILALRSKYRNKYNELFSKL